MIIKGKSADLKQTALKEHRTLNYENKTLGGIANEVAERAGLQVASIGSVGSELLGSMVHQLDESDMNLLQRLTRENGPSCR